MADYVPPVSFKRYSVTEHSVTYTLPGHSSSKPHLVIFDRVIPVTSGKGSRVPQLRVRVIRGVMDANGVLLSTRITHESTHRYPIGALASEIIEDMAILASIGSDVAFQDDVANELRLPL